MIKIKSHELVSLIKNLTKTEKAKFKDSISHQNRASNFYQLFEYIDRSKSIDYSKLRALFHSDTSFYDAKKYLFNRIVDVLINETSKKDKELENIYNTQLAYVLYKKNIFDLSEKILKEIVLEQTNSIQAGVQVLATVLLTRIGFMKQDLELLNYSDKQQQDLLNYIAIVEKYRSFKIVTDPKYDDIQFIEANLVDFQADEKKFKSPRDKNGFNYFMALLFELKLNNFEKAFEFHEKSYQLFLNDLKGTEHKISIQNIEVSLAIFYHYIVSCILLNKMEEAEMAMVEFNLFDKNCHLKNDFFHKLKIIINCFYAAWCSKNVDRILSDSIKHFEVMDLTSKNTLDFYAFTYFNCCLFQIGNYKEVVVNMLSCYNVLKNRINIEFYSFQIMYNYFLLIVSHLKLKNFDVVENFIEKMMKEQVVQHVYLIEFKTIIKDYCLLIINGQNKSQDQVQILSRCDELQKQPFYKLYPFMDIKRWIQNSAH